jgi:large subunit ribosomal protein L22
MDVKKGFRAIAKNLPMSPTKIRPIADHVRRKKVVEAVAILESLPNKGAGYLKKVIESAAANAMYQDQNVDEESLYIAELLVDGGPSRKTIWPRSHGRADRQIKRSSHISVILDQKAVN